MQSVHELRAAQVAVINSNTSLWRASASPRFASQPPGASKRSNGVLGDWAADIRAAVAWGEIEPFVSGDANAAIPDEFDSETNWPACAKSAPSATESCPPFPRPWRGGVQEKHSS